MKYDLLDTTNPQFDLTKQMLIYNVVQCGILYDSCGVNIMYIQKQFDNLIISAVIQNCQQIDMFCE